MPICRKAKITGELKRTLNPHKILKEIYGDKLTVTEEYNNYGNIIMYNPKGALAWFRQNGFYADMMIGCINEDLFNDIKSVKSDFITWI